MTFANTALLDLAIAATAASSEVSIHTGTPEARAKADAQGKPFNDQLDQVQLLLKGGQIVAERLVRYLDSGFATTESEAQQRLQRMQARIYG